MKKFFYLSAVVLLLCFAANLAGQQSQEQSESDNKMLFAYQRNFARGSLSTKVQVLQDAAARETSGMGKLYLQGIDFYLDNFNTLREDATAIELVKLAARLAAEAGYKPASADLWQLFQRSDDIGIQVAAIQSIGRLLESDDQLLTSLIEYLKVRNSMFREGDSVQLQVIAETITALAMIGSTDAFPVLFATAHRGYPQQIEEKAAQALDSLEGDPSAMIMQVLEEGFPQEKLPALSWAMQRDSLSRAEKGRIAQKALSEGLKRISNPEQHEQLRQLRYEATRYLTELKWSEATSLTIEHFDRTNIEVDRGITSQSILLEAIACLGAMGTNEAALRLSLYLEVLNTYRENGQRVDEQVALAVINNLGALGDDVAFDHLLYTMYLDYPRSVKQAAREVLSEFKQ
jgi:hypothetical protein